MRRLLTDRKFDSSRACVFEELGIGLAGDARIRIGDLLNWVESELTVSRSTRRPRCLDHRPDARLERLRQGRPGVDQLGQIGVGFEGFLRATAVVTAAV